MLQTTLAIAGAALTILLSCCSGLLLFRSLRIELRGLERYALASLAGSTLVSFSTLVLAIAGLAHPISYCLLAALALAGCLWRRVFVRERPEPPRLKRRFRLVPLALFAVFGWIYLLHAMAPECSPDGSYYHLGFVSLYNEAGRLVKVPDNMYAHFPQSVEMLFLTAFSVGRHSAASLVELAFLADLAVLLYCFGCRLGLPWVGLFGSFAVFASPIVGWTGTRAYIDVAVAAAVFGMFYFLQLWEWRRSVNLLIPAGLLAGFAFGSKYTAVLVLPLGIAWILLLGKRRPYWEYLRGVLVFLSCAALLFAPWLARNWVWYGNPFSPFFNRWFPNPYTFPSFEREYSALLRSLDGLSGWYAIPLEVTVRGFHLQGLLGPLFLLAPVSLLALRNPVGRRLCAAALVFTATYPLNLGTRFLITALPFVALAIGTVIAKLRGAVPALILAHALTAFPAVVDRYSHPYAMRLGRVPSLAEAFRTIPEDVTLRSRSCGYEAARAVERLVPAESEVYSFIGFPEAYSRKKGLTYYTSARANMITESLLSPMSVVPLFRGRPMLSGLKPDLAPVCEMLFSFPSATISAIRLVEPRVGDGAIWSVSDVRIFRSGRVVQFSSEMRVTASHSHWYAARAFDDNPATLWSSREPVCPGMYLGAAFSTPEQADTVVVRSPRDQQSLVPKLEGFVEGVGWRLLDGRPSVSIVPAPANLRRLAAQAVRRDGVEYLLVNEGNAVADDFTSHLREWMLEKVASAGNFTLYRIVATDTSSP